MTSYVLPPPVPVAIPVEGEAALFPVRRVLCVGRNYAAHRREMGGDDRDPPFFFAKPADAVVTPGGEVPYPPGTSNFHHEIELVAALGSGGSEVSVERALDLVLGYAVGVDLTRRDLQAKAREKQQPWDAAKGFDHAAQRLADADPDQLVLSAEPAVDDARGHPRLRDDVLHGRGVEPVRGEPAPGRREDLAPAPLDVSICDSRHIPP